MQLRELKEVLQMTFTGCRVIQETDLQVVDRSWEVDLEDYLMSRALEGKTAVSYTHLIFENDPFAKLDQTGVGKLMKMAIELGKPVNPKLHVGICGEHGGDPSSVEFCNSIGLDYVSCSPFRVPIARLAAAQAAIANR